jgi:hypothetical protein
VVLSANAIPFPFSPPLSLSLSVCVCVCEQDEVSKLAEATAAVERMRRMAAQRISSPGGRGADDDGSPSRNPRRATEQRIVAERDALKQEVAELRARLASNDAAAAARPRKTAGRGGPGSPGKLDRALAIGAPRRASPPPLSGSPERQFTSCHDSGKLAAENAALHEQVSHFCACIGSPCLRQCVHGASIGGAAQQAARRGRA